MTTIGDLVGRLVDLGVDVREATTIIDEAVQFGASRPTRNKRKRDETAAKATRLPKDWNPTPEEVQFGIDLGIPMHRVQREIGNFKDYWAGAPGQKGCKADWPATWRNRMRQVADYLGCSPIKKPSIVGDNVTAIDWKPIIHRYRMTSNWNPSFGPEPGMPGCRVPKELVKL